MYMHHFVTDELPASLASLRASVARSQAATDPADRRSALDALERAVADLEVKARVALAVWGHGEVAMAASSTGGPSRMRGSACPPRLHA